MTGWDASIVGGIGARYWDAAKLCLAIGLPAVLLAALLGLGLRGCASVGVTTIVVPEKTVSAHEFIGEDT